MDERLYFEDICRFEYDLSFLKNRSVFISGASGLIGRYLVDVIMHKNIRDDLNCHVYALGRNEIRMDDYFKRYKETGLLSILIHDICKPLTFFEHVDYVLHLAGNTHPVLYSSKPIETIEVNLLGTINMLDICRSNPQSRFLLASSVEVYGEENHKETLFSEKDFGYIDPNTLRADYPESKRCAETLCQAYHREYDIDFLIARLARVYGPSMLMNDSKSMSQFLLNGIRKEDIVLKSKGEQLFSYCYVADAVAGILFLLEKGENTHAYNIAEDTVISLKQIASIIAEYSGTKVVFDLPNSTEKEGFSKAKNAILSCEKIEKAGWKATIGLEEGIKRTLDILGANRSD